MVVITSILQEKDKDSKRSTQLLGGNYVLAGLESPEKGGRGATKIPELLASSCVLKPCNQ